MQAMMNNPEMMQQMMDSPMVQGMMNNPDVMREMMMSNPQMRAAIEANPEMERILLDPVSDDSRPTTSYFVNSRTLIGCTDLPSKGL